MGMFVLLADLIPLVNGVLKHTEEINNANSATHSCQYPPHTVTLKIS